MSVLTRLFRREEDPAIVDARKRIAAGTETVSLATNRLYIVMDGLLDEQAAITGRPRRDVASNSPE